MEWMDWFKTRHCEFQNFLLPIDLEPENMEKTDEIRFKLTSLYDQSPVILWFHERDQVKIITENMDLAGNIIQSLANFLNIEHLMVKNQCLF